MKLLVACLLVGSLVCCFVVLEKKKNKSEVILYIDSFSVFIIYNYCKKRYMCICIYLKCFLLLLTLYKRH